MSAKSKKLKSIFPTFTKKKHRHSLLLLAAFAFMAIAGVVLAQTINNFTGENRSKAAPPPDCNMKCQVDTDCQTTGYCYQPPMPECKEGLRCAQAMPNKICRNRKYPTDATCPGTTPSCVAEGKTFSFLDKKTCCSGLVAAQKDKSTTICQRPTTECVKEGGSVPVIANPPKCCEGLVLQPPKPGLVGSHGTCIKSTSSCVEEGKTFSFLDKKTCCSGLVAVQKDKSTSICQKPKTTCAKVGEKISLIPSKNINEVIKCCDGLGYTKLNSSTGICITPKKCNQTCSSDTQCAEGLFCYKFVSIQNGVIDKSRSYSRCRSRVAKTNTSCPQYKKINQ